MGVTKTHELNTQHELIRFKTCNGPRSWIPMRNKKRSPRLPCFRLACFRDIPTVLGYAQTVPDSFRGPRKAFRYSMKSNDSVRPQSRSHIYSIGSLRARSIEPKFSEISVQPEKFRKNGSTFWGGPLFPVGWMDRALRYHDGDCNENVA